MAGIIANDNCFTETKSNIIIVYGCLSIKKLSETNDKHNWCYSVMLGVYYHENVIKWIEINYLSILTL